MYADAIVAGVMNASMLPTPKTLPVPPKLDRMHFKVRYLRHYIIH